MKQAHIVFLIDIQNGFAKPDLTPEQGGSLYVPEGEAVGKPASDLIGFMEKTTFVLSQDYHPKDHISFASNHKGSNPMEEIFLKKNSSGIFTPCEKEEGGFAQTLWPDHCVQGTTSALFVDEIMNALPERLVSSLKSEDKSQTLFAKGPRGNAFHVIRKGMRPDLDSYGIGTENDKLSLTAAPVVFQEIARDLKAKGVTEVVASICGLATNFCVEYSNYDVQKFLIPTMKTQGIATKVQFLTDISRGIPIAVPDGSWPDLEASGKRMLAQGTQTISSGELMRSFLKGQPSAQDRRLII